jgi:tRNA-specific 2-thiouridylase
VSRVVVGLSGGVDSAVAALLLRREGHEVLGVFMKNWEEQDEQGVCAAERDAADARAVCDCLDIPFYAVNFARTYWDRVFSYCLAEFGKARTPNPDVLCNREIKFRAFLDFAMAQGADALATGHFCRTDEAGRLLRGADAQKDQSYFLYMLRQEQLLRTRFPVGEMAKAEVRALAREAGLPVAEKKDSTGICFIGERNFKRFLQGFLPAQPGEIRARTGEVLGRHDGLMYYTLGQRRGLGIGGRGDGRRWFVVEKDLGENRLVVDQGEDSPLLYAASAQCVEASWIGGAPPASEFECTAKFRYRQPDQAVAVSVAGDGVFVLARTPQRALTPGQSVVFYDGEICLGGAVIDRTA